MLYHATISVLPLLREDQVEEIANRRLGHCDVIGFVSPHGLAFSYLRLNAYIQKLKVRTIFGKHLYQLLAPSLERQNK